MQNQHPEFLSPWSLRSRSYYSWTNRLWQRKWTTRSHWRESFPGAKSPFAAGATINGVAVINNDSLVPLFPYLPGYGLLGIRGAFKFGETSEVFVDFENILDKSYRGISWGVDGGDRGVTVRY